MTFLVQPQLFLVVTSTFTVKKLVIAVFNSADFYRCMMTFEPLRYAARLGLIVSREMSRSFT